MRNVALFSGIFLIGEILAFLIFLLVKKKFERKWQRKIDRQTVKGWLERFFLFLCLAYNLPHALIAFGAIKIGTRVNDGSEDQNEDGDEKDDGGDRGDASDKDKDGDEEEHKSPTVSSDYFFIGNIISLLLVVLYYAAWLALIKPKCPH
jgi:hypothetical protein